MLTVPQAVLATMDAGKESIRGLIRFDLGSGTYGFARSSVPITYDGVVYRPSSLIGVGELPMSMGTQADGFTVELAASPQDDLTPEVLSTIHSEDYRDRPVTILDAIYDPDTGALLSVEVMKRGYIDFIDHVADPEGGDRLIAQCEGRGLDYSRRNGRQANDADQARRSATDTFFKHASSAGTVEFKWGE